MNTVTQTVWDSENRTGTDRPERLVEYIAWLNAALEKIPPHLRETATVEIEACPSYENSAVLEYRIQYRRPKTEQELADDEREREAWRLLQERAEREQYERLRAKFGLPNPQAEPRGE